MGASCAFAGAAGRAPPITRPAMRVTSPEEDGMKCAKSMFDATFLLTSRSVGRSLSNRWGELYLNALLLGYRACRSQALGLEDGMTVCCRWFRCALVFALVFSAPAMAWAQTGTSSLIGEVTDAQKSVIPGATVTLTNAQTGVSQSSVTDERGAYRFANMPPGRYEVRVELSGFKTSIISDVVLQVDSTARQNAVLELGGITETVQVVSEAPIVNTTDASLGNALSPQQIRSLPVEAQNVVHLLSLQPGAVFIPVTNPATADPRYGSVTGARSDQQNVTLDGIDVNDPQNQTAYTSAVRMTQESLQEFRVSTSTYNADMGRSSGPQVTLVTRSGGNQFDGAMYGTFRRTATSSNEYFLKLSQLGSGLESEPPKLDKNIFGGSFGGPIRRNRLFFFGNFERLNEQSESPVDRGVPSDSFRDGVLLYRCAVASACPGGSAQGFSRTHAVPAGWYGLTPAEIAGLDPLGIGPSRAASQYFAQYPSPNEPGLDGNNIMGYRFAAPIENIFNTFISRVDYKASESGSHNFFGRFGRQGDTINNAPQFPGQESRQQRLFNNYGVAVGYDAVLSTNLTNSFRYGITKIDEENAGRTNGNYTAFRFISSFDASGETFTSARSTPMQNIVNDLSWFKGAHTFKVGTNLRFTRIPKLRTNGSYLSASVNPSWVAGVGRRNMPGSSFCTAPICSQLPAVSSTGQAGYADAWLNILGVLSQATQRANYDRDGTPLPPGTPLSREIASDEYELYVQDSWQVSSNLTLTAGVRYSLYSPPYEVNGLQVQPTISMGEWFNTRVGNMESGIPSSASEVVTFDLSGPKNNRPGFYAWDKNNFAPRVAVAWSPTAPEGGFWRWLTGENALVVRGGYTKVFDRVGTGLANNFDEGFAFGMSTTLSSPFGLAYESDPRVRFTEPGALPPTVPAAPPGGFPQTPPLRRGVITTSIDDTLVTPSAHMVSAVFGRDLTRNLAIEAGYIGRFGRDLLIRRDIAMPLNLTDTRSGTDYFTAAQTLINAAQARGLTGNSPDSAYAALASIPYWENLFPGAAGGGLTATQAVARAYMAYAPDWISALWELDQFCEPACSIHGPFAFFSEQYDSLAAVSSIGKSNYHGLVLTLRKRYSAGTQFDFNYTLSESKDHGSQVERGSAFGNFSNGGYTGFLVNSFDQELNWGNSDFDVRHQINVNALAELPFGEGKRWANTGGPLNQLVGGWSVAGLLRWTTGFPFNVFNCRSCWTTNWNLQGNAMLVDENRLPPTETTRNVVDGRPSPFPDPDEALTYFRRALPGESGIRNRLRGDGYFTIDLSIAKGFDLGIADHRLRFRMDVFNVTNTPKFDVGDLTMFPDRAGFGRYNGTL
ncbi:MAG TPA: TonB-dependent receptor, partial [Vicinamibacterales bacterium]|nr:TonB-dependent receptor [Vicinamibacterales bacterium]